VRFFSSRLSLRWRLTLATFGLLAVLFGALGLLLTLTEEQTLLRTEAGTLHDVARTAWTRGAFRVPAGGNGTNAPVTLDLYSGSSPASPPATGDPPAQFETLVAPVIVRRLSGPNTAASVLTTSGDLIAAAATDSGQLVTPVQPDSDMIQAALTRPVTAENYQLATDANGQRQLVVLLPIVSSGHTVALLELNTPTTQIDRSVANTRVLLFFGIGGCLVLAALLARPLLDAALRPLVTMERTTRRIADGALSLRLEEPATEDEIGRLTRSFNVMVARLDAAFSRQRRFVADVSHELRTPLTALAGGIEMLMLGADRQDEDPAARQRLLRGLYAETERMRRLVEDLLTLARLDEGRMQLRLAAVDVGALVGEVGEQAQHLARGQEIAVSVAPDLPRVRADADRLRQVLLNLVENAVKFTPAPGQITLSARTGTAGRSVVIEVRDTGIGISPEDLPHVFDRFYRVDTARTRSASQPGGSGLGLAIAKSLLEAQGGSLSISSQPSQGTAVVLELPTAGGERLRQTGARPTAGRLGAPRRTIPKPVITSAPDGSSPTLPTPSAAGETIAHES
jgi:two-component system OmpR family sensor kinase